MSEKTNVPLSQRELKHLTVMVAGFLEQVTTVMRHMRDNNEADLNVAKMGIETSVLLVKLESYRQSAVQTEVAELNELFDLPSVDPSVDSSVESSEGKPTTDV